MQYSTVFKNILIYIPPIRITRIRFVKLHLIHMHILYICIHVKCNKNDGCISVKRWWMYLTHWNSPERFVYFIFSFKDMRI